MRFKSAGEAITKAQMDARFFTRNFTMTAREAERIKRNVKKNSTVNEHLYWREYAKQLGVK